MPNRIALPHLKRPVMLPPLPHVSPAGGSAGSGRLLWPALALAALFSAGSAGLGLMDHDPSSASPALADTASDRTAGLSRCHALVIVARLNRDYRTDELRQLIEVCRAAL